MSVDATMSEPESHAQFAEDRILAEIFGDRTAGREAGLAMPPG
jgi:hypothetical protein